jgi:hypothetical protein
MSTEKFLNPSRFGVASTGYGRIDFRAFVEVGTTLEDVLKPEFWSMVAGEISRAGTMPHIEVIADDMTFYAQLLVLHSGSTYAKAICILHVDFAERGESVEDLEKIEEDCENYKIAYKGPALKYCIVDKLGTIVSGGDRKKTKVEAQQFLKEHLVSLAM